MTTTEATLHQLQKKIARFGKENLEEIVFTAAEGIQAISGRGRIRIYLEDVTGGALSCCYVAGPHGEEIMGTTFPIVSRSSLVSTVFATQAPRMVSDTASSGLSLDMRLDRNCAIGSTCQYPLVNRGRSIGVVCLDEEAPGAFATDPNSEALLRFLVSIADKVDEARKYNQQILLTRRVEEYKKREAAAFMVKSAVRLIDRLSLASVLVPTIGSHGRKRMEILASYSADPRLKALYDDLGAIKLGRGRSLVSQYIGDDGYINNDTLLEPVFIPNLTQQVLQKRALTEKMFLRSLYMVPRYDPDTRKVICLVNYYSRENSSFTEFEAGILQTHAEMVERVIREIGDEHLEVRVFAEITDLLRERKSNLPTFLEKVLSKATKLIGADTGSIAMVQERDGEKWLVVEEENGTIVGAKNKEWVKKKIPAFRVGGHELPVAQRSLTGYVAWSKDPKIISDIKAEITGEGFHYTTSELIRSEIAVPIICDDMVLGVICLNSLREGYFSEEHKRILQIIESLTSRHIADIQQIETLQSQVARLTSDVAYKDPTVSSYRLGNIIGNSRKAQEVVDFINTVSAPLLNRILFWRTAAWQEATIGLPSVLVLGPTGSGKEFFFNNLYNKLTEMYRERVNAGVELPVRKMNIAAYSGELTYSELFGHKKGAFTGAYSDRRGILEEAQGGVVFLDEIGDADPKTQVQLLRFLDNGGFIRLGESAERYGRVLLVAATNKNLQEEIKAGRFREDLYQRLSELSVTIPPLSERKEDIPDLAVHFLGKLHRTYRGKDDPEQETPVLSEGAKGALVNHWYEGNVRELRSILLRALFFRSGEVITEEDIRRAIGQAANEQQENSHTRLQNRVADDIVAQIRSGMDFWEAVYEPYSKNRISRDVVGLVIERSRLEAGRTMPQIARHLKATTGDIEGDPAERRKFFKFKNFLYKTVRI
ncbi:GPMC system transcriptional regulator [Geomonas sp. RF6]|uniref:GPMC system transcriptional regulator n=1 Tax=Geomonas sp. RF6 TaxID=2897342 RepID=UPI001E36B888|nr:GPMC system transcriptional regulator [Geomonas sp. RF6]UFS69285.1 GPMC system transcriptional regulator [Geomonas sp. RF6]